MPISDASYLLRAAAAGALAATEDGTGVDVGPGPINGMLVRIYVPATGTTVTMNIAECATLGGSYVDVQEGPWTFTTLGTYIRRIWWSKRYIRHEVTAITGDFGAVTIGLVHGAEPN